MHVLDELDEPKAALRMLLMLSANQQGMNVTWLLREMREVYGVGRPAVESTYKALMGAGLVGSDYMMGSGAGSKLRVIALTQLWVEVALKIGEIGVILGGAKKLT